MATLVKAEVLKPFIGDYDSEDDRTGKRTGERRFSNAQGVIPRGFYHQTKRHLVKPHIIELTEARFKELSDPARGIVRAYDPTKFKEQVGVGQEHTNRQATIPLNSPQRNTPVNKGGIKETK